MAPGTHRALGAFAPRARQRGEAFVSFTARACWKESLGLVEPSCQIRCAIAKGIPPRSCSVALSPIRFQPSPPCDSSSLPCAIPALSPARFQPSPPRHPTPLPRAIPALSPLGRGWPATAFSPAVAGRVRGSTQYRGPASRFPLRRKDSPRRSQRVTEESTSL